MKQNNFAEQQENCNDFALTLFLMNITVKISQYLCVENKYVILTFLVFFNICFLFIFTVLRRLWTISTAPAQILPLQERECSLTVRSYCLSGIFYIYNLSFRLILLHFSRTSFFPACNVPPPLKFLNCIIIVHNFFFIFDQILSFSVLFLYLSNKKNIYKKSIGKSQWSESNM